MKMTKISLLLVLVFLLSACAMSSSEKAFEKALYDKYSSHCREYAVEEFAKHAEADQQALYEECMNYHIRKDTDCPYCILDPEKK
ncbi:MAG: hypothetical protein C0622_10215 [Desulfuromonas sp.]|nr:MAG: hypothetical protein C0622_10215 [Desulfuromonas sp.]